MPKQPPASAPDSTAALLTLCRDILVCAEGLSAGAARTRSNLLAGADPDRAALQGQADGAGRLQALVKTLGRRLGEASIHSERQEEVRRAVETVRARLACLANAVETDYALVSRRGVRIPGVGGRPHPRRRFGPPERG
ncbi:MAG: hypothetical protein A3F84_10575 [Candidatus Handelsmanbacteria bacterium RIFCSPLOWO2_12_FULL_64_10]|uniref:Flagellar protein FlgN n=1 Tax=Handelsmanbacteria sp. (strain RIFCSPLOWO2_12_FULL_64_10) TaxID=1817868 RepID=A0A1F6D5V4_HANXR|nr:MAG: hypothetical protein A3F84_10575 [Candidatus Handelsmanbacteria bacterium RIFCSPLOWO2_12_FULL_64_10]